MSLPYAFKNYIKDYYRYNTVTRSLRRMKDRPRSTNNISEEHYKLLESKILDLLRKNKWTVVKELIIDWYYLANDELEMDFICDDMDLNSPNDCVICRSPESLQSYFGIVEDYVITHPKRTDYDYDFTVPIRFTDPLILVVWLKSHDLGRISFKDIFSRLKSCGLHCYYHWQQKFGCAHFHVCKSERLRVDLGRFLLNIYPYEMKTVIPLFNCIVSIYKVLSSRYKCTELNKKNLFDVPLPLENIRKYYSGFGYNIACLYALCLSNLSLPLELINFLDKLNRVSILEIGLWSNSNQSMLRTFGRNTIDKGRLLLTSECSKKLIKGAVNTYIPNFVYVISQDIGDF